MSFIYQGITTSEIASNMSISEKTLYVHKYIIRKSLICEQIMRYFASFRNLPVKQPADLSASNSAERIKKPAAAGFTLRVKEQDYA